MAEGGPCTKIAENLCVDKSTVSRTLTLFHLHVCLVLKPYKAS